jgi:AraC family transcriptional regulator, transcriptional activator of pobA
MNSKLPPHIHVRSIAEHNVNIGFPKPKHPLFAIQRFEDFPRIISESPVRLTMDFFQITFKKNCSDKLQYGQSVYDFDEGVLSFFAPNQVFIKEGEITPPAGYLILLHPDYLKGYALESRIRTYGFFDYAVSEALILSAEEEDFIESVFLQIEKEFNRPIDALSQDVIISNLELLLTYSNRFYTRQFITRKPQYDSLLARFEQLLDRLFQDAVIAEKGLPGLADLAAAFHLSPKYFSDLIRQHSGRTTQQHIHDKLIAKAKEKLSGTEASISEIAFQLGFEHPQSFSKLFKSKTSQSPGEFRHGFTRTGH